MISRKKNENSLMLSTHFTIRKSSLQQFSSNVVALLIFNEERGLATKSASSKYEPGRIEKNKAENSGHVITLKIFFNLLDLFFRRRCTMRSRPSE